MSALSGGALVAQALRELGVEHIYSVSGNQILPIYDAAGELGLRIIHMRHESAAAYAALAEAELTGKPGVALVSAGPGFVASLVGVAIARSMELPLLLLSGASPLSQAGMGAFQELDQAAMAGAVCKASLVAHSAAELPAQVGTAWWLALEGVPGPVHLSLPADVLLAETEYTQVDGARAAPAALTAGERAALRDIAVRLAAARRPVVITRPAAARGAAGAALAELCDKLGLMPFMTDAPRGFSDLKYLDVAPLLPAADFALVVAPSDFVVSFLEPEALARDGLVALIDAPGDPQPARAALLHLRLPDPAAALQALAAALTGPLAIDLAWASQWQLNPPPDAPADWAGNALHPLAVTDALRTTLQPDDIIVLDGGEFSQWVRWGLRDLPNTVIWNGKFGAIGGAVPIALGAAVTRPNSRVIAIAGDGGVGYHLMELETAARYGLPIVLLIGNDGLWATEWHLQVDRYGPDRAFETNLTQARYDRTAEGLGGRGRFISQSDDLQPALVEAFDAAVATCLNVLIAPLRSPAVLRH